MAVELRDTLVALRKAENDYQQRLKEVGERQPRIQDREHRRRRVPLDSEAADDDTL